MEDPIGEWRCGDCETSFKILDSNIVEAYDGWEPTCPTCGTQNDIEKVGEPATV